MRISQRLSAVLLSALILALAVGCSGGGSNSPVNDRLSQISVAPVSQTSVGPVIAGMQRYIIGFVNKPGTSEEALVTGMGGQINNRYQIIPAMAVTLPTAAVATVGKSPLVAYVEPDYIAHASADTIPWGITDVKAPQVWPLPNTGSGVKLCIVDTGIDYNHADLAANYRGGYDFVNNDSDPKDDNGHGTHVSGTAGAKGNGTDVEGVAPDVSLYSCKVLDKNGSGYYSWIIAGIDWARTNGMNIVSMSLGGSSGSTSLQQACDNAYAANVLLVAAAGNSGNSGGTGDNVGYPARYDSCIAVAAVDSNNVRAYFSSTGPKVEVAAPGVSVVSDKMGGGTISYSGTSMATPHVSGTAALIFASGITKATDVRARLDYYVTDLGAAGRDNLYGYGLINAYVAVTGMAPPPPPPPVTYGNLKGKVYNAKTGKVINSVTIKVDTGQNTKTNSQGNYTINNILTGNHNVTASKSGYAPSTLPVTITNGSTVTLNFYLTPL
jgi:subtilisin family serine protease